MIEEGSGAKSNSNDQDQINAAILEEQTDLIVSQEKRQNYVHSKINQSKKSNFYHH